jgi:hypothetical protein
VTSESNTQFNSVESERNPQRAATRANASDSTLSTPLLGAETIIEETDT